MRISLSGLLLFAFASATGYAQERPVPSIYPQGHRVEIRAALMKADAEVQTFIVTKLLPKDAPPPAVEMHNSAASESHAKGGKFIRVRLGEYIDNPATIFLPAPLVMAKEVIAQWSFDEQDRLIDIVVEKKSATY